MHIRKLIRKIRLHSPISVGMRTFKSGLAATITATIGLTSIIGNPFYALMGAVFGMQNTVSNSLKLGIGRIIGTAIGAFIGFIFAYFELVNPFAIGFAVALVIVICGLLKIQNSILITVTLCLLIMFNPTREGGLFHYAFFRTLDTALGVIIGILVNRFIAPPNHLKALITELEILSELTQDILKYPHKLPQLKKEITNLTAIHNNYQIDIKYDNHEFSHENLLKTVEASSELYFHFKSCDTIIEHVKHYHLNEINQTLILLQQTLSELKGVK